MRLTVLGMNFQKIVDVLLVNTGAELRIADVYASKNRRAISAGSAAMGSIGFCTAGMEIAAISTFEDCPPFIDGSFGSTKLFELDGTHACKTSEMARSSMTAWYGFRFIFSSVDESFEIIVCKPDRCLRNDGLLR